MPAKGALELKFRIVECVVRAGSEPAVAAIRHLPGLPLPIFDTGNLLLEILEIRRRFFPAQRHAHAESGQRKNTEHRRRYVAHVIQARGIYIAPVPAKMNFS